MFFRIGLFFIFLGFALAAIIVCCFFWYICCNAMINAWTAYRRREGRSLVPSARPPSSRAPSGRAHDHALRDIFPLRNPAGNFFPTTSLPIHCLFNFRQFFAWQQHLALPPAHPAARLQYHRILPARKRLFADVRRSTG